jgi:undecaprenyl diphosphate synthase
VDIQHIAFIADGNRRFAKRHLLPRYMGHKRGFDKMIKAADWCLDLGIPVCSFFAFSTENWNREKAEIDEIFRLIRENIDKQIAHFVKKGIRVLFLGDLTKFPKDFQESALKVAEETKNLTGMTLALCVNYGGRADIVRAANSIENFPVTEKEFGIHLYGAELPDPDIVVRTGGEYRISNFMLWQMAYSELFFIDTLWPDITKDVLINIIADYNKRDRRKGK